MNELEQEKVQIFKSVTGLIGQPNRTVLYHWLKIFPLSQKNNSETLQPIMKDNIEVTDPSKTKINDR